jgi:periplasmic divalent cation tolerance protein
MPDPILVLVSSKPSDAQSLAKTLVEEKLAACVSICRGMNSIYRWEGEVCEATESLLLIKTDRRCYANLENRIQSLHNYEVPEIIALEIKVGFAPYLSWLDESVVESTEFIRCGEPE